MPVHNKNVHLELNFFSSFGFRVFSLQGAGFPFRHVWTGYNHAPKIFRGIVLLPWCTNHKTIYPPLLVEYACLWLLGIMCWLLLRWQGKATWHWAWCMYHTPGTLSQQWDSNCFGWLTSPFKDQGNRTSSQLGWSSWNCRWSLSHKTTSSCLVKL